jgi:hypothetical protein
MRGSDRAIGLGSHVLLLINLPFNDKYITCLAYYIKDPKALL